MTDVSAGTEQLQLVQGIAASDERGAVNRQARADGMGAACRSKVIQ